SRLSFTPKSATSMAMVRATSGTRSAWRSAMLGSSAASSAAPRLHVNEESSTLPGSVAAAPSERDPRDMGSLLMIFGIALTLISGLPAEGRAAEATLRCPATARAGQHFTVEVTIDVGTTPLGAYSIVVGYDPTVLRIASVAGGGTAEFPRPPTTNT